MFSGVLKVFGVCLLLSVTRAFLRRNSSNLEPKTVEISAQNISNSFYSIKKNAFNAHEPSYLKKKKTTTMTSTDRAFSSISVCRMVRSSSSRRIKVQKTIQSKAFILRNVGDLDRNHLEEEGNNEEKEDTIPRVLRLNGAKSVVGRVSSSAVNLAVGVATVSSAHAMVDLTPDGKVMVTDLTSTNGTYIDGEELLPGIPQELTEGGEVIFGDEHCARFELVVEP